MNLEKEKIRTLEKIYSVNVTLNVPRFISVKFSQEITVCAHELDFKETHYYLKGDYSLILKIHRESFYLSKRKIS